MDPLLRAFFEEQVRFRLEDGSEISVRVFIGGTEILPLTALQGDDKAYEEEYRAWLDERWRPQQSQRRADILALFGNAKRYNDLHAAVRRRQVVPFVGSGMSVPSGLPTWSGLLRRASEYSHCEPDDLEHFVASSQFEEAADLIASKTNARLFNERIEHDLRVEDKSAITGAVCLLPSLFPGLVITSNLDDVIEEVYLLAERPFRHVLAGDELSKYRSLLSSESSLLVKLHGDRSRREGRVLLSREYELTYGVDSSIREAIELLYKTNHLLFLGCSLGPDRTVRLIHEVASVDSNMPKHYCFMRMPEKDVERIERENFLTEHGIYPI